MLTRILKSNDMELFSLHIKNKDQYQFISIAKTCINANKLEAFKILLDKFRSLEDSEYTKYDFYYKSLLQAVEYKRYDILNFLIPIIKENKIQLNSEDINFIYNAAAQQIKMVKFLQEHYPVRKEYIPSMIFRVSGSTLKKRNKKQVYKLTDYYINLLGYFPSVEIFKIIKKHDCFIRINHNFNKDIDFEFHNFLLKYDKENYIIKRFKGLMTKQHGAIYELYNDLNNRIHISERVNDF